MKHKVEKLEGALLDAAVAKAEGWSADEVAAMATNPEGANRYMAASTWWGIGGPIIERERIVLVSIGQNLTYEQNQSVGWWIAGFDASVSQGVQCDSGWLELPAIELKHEQSAATPLVAAMRAYVASKCGDEVELP
jgi:hypothetical protein